jgi:hypothetical protein
VDIPVDFGRNVVLAREGDETVFPVVEDLHKPQTVRRSNRAWKPSRRYLKGKNQEGYKIHESLHASLYDDRYMTKIHEVNPI